MEWWFSVYLQSARLLGYKVVWTAHDLVPHERVFESDDRARGVLLSRAKIVIALSEATAAELRTLGARSVRVIPMGSYAEPYPVTVTKEKARASFGFDEHDVVVSLIGRVEAYKGADLLLQAVAQLPASSRIKVLLAGLCTDKTYRSELLQLAGEAGGRAVLDFQWIPDGDLARYLQATDFAVFPFREITNSVSILLAQSFGLPVIIPDLPTLRDIPSDTAIRFEPGFDSLVAVLQRTESLSATEYRALSGAALRWSARADWTDIARDTIAAYEAALLDHDK